MILTEGAVRGLEAERVMISGRRASLARRTGYLIGTHLTALAEGTMIGEPREDAPGLHEVLMPTGNGRYTALVRHDPAADALYVLAFRHCNDAGY